MKKSFLIIFIIFGLSFCIFGQENSREHAEAEKIHFESSSKHLSEINTKPDNKPLKIIFKPKPRYPQSDSGSVCIQGTVSLRVEFLKSGEIGKVLAVNELPFGATENAIKTAKEIIFEPEIVNGEPVTVKRRVQFSFTIY